MPYPGSNSRSIPITPTLFGAPEALGIILLIAAVSTGFAQRPMGVDVSSFQGTGIDWAAVKNFGISFAWAKATEGLTVNDGAFTVNEANARAAGVLIGAYHFAHPDTHLGLAGADEEAAHFWSVVSNYIGGSGTYLMPVLDYEVTVTNVSPPYTAATLSAWANEWCLDVSKLCRGEGCHHHARRLYLCLLCRRFGWISDRGLDSSITNRPL